jgi:hypothetical protein
MGSQIVNSQTIEEAKLNLSEVEKKFFYPTFKDEERDPKSALIPIDLSPKTDGDYSSIPLNHHSGKAISSICQTILKHPDIKIGGFWFKLGLKHFEALSEQSL